MKKVIAWLALISLVFLMSCDSAQSGEDEWAVYWYLCGSDLSTPPLDIIGFDACLMAIIDVLPRRAEKSNLISNRYEANANSTTANVRRQLSSDIRCGGKNISA